MAWSPALETDTQRTEAPYTLPLISMRLATPIPVRCDQRQALNFSVKLIFSHDTPTRVDDMGGIWVFVTLVDEFNNILDNDQTLGGVRAQSVHPIQRTEETFLDKDVATAMFTLAIRVPGKYRLCFTAIDMQRQMRVPDTSSFDTGEYSPMEDHDAIAGKVQLSLVTEPFEVTSM